MDPLSFTILMYTIATGVVSSALWEGSKRAYLYRNSRAPLKTFYKFDRDCPVFIIQSALEHTVGGEFFAYTSGIDGVYAYRHVWEYLMSIKYRPNHINLTFAPEVGVADLDDNLILIGGYENNQVSEKINKDPNRAFFFEDNTIFHKSKLDEGWKIVADNNNQIIHDYCLVTRMPNPYRANNSRTNVIAFEGVRHFGTLGGVRFMNESNLSQQKKLFGCTVADAEIFEVVLGFDVSHLNSGGFVLKNPTVEAVAKNGKRIK